jgi:hypothetical protein
MIDVLESLNLTQRSQWNEKEMSWDERGCFGSAQCTHKNVKSPRERAKSRPPSIYRRTPSQIAIGLKTCTTDAVTLSNRRGTPASVARMATTCPASSNFNGRIQPTDTSVVAETQRLSSRRTQSSKLLKTTFVPLTCPS